jgi:hypothetical protein
LYTPYMNHCVGLYSESNSCVYFNGDCASGSAYPVMSFDDTSGCGGCIYEMFAKVDCGTWWDCVCN